MKIAILTFARTNNYGATLQCYALCKYIESRGHSVDILNVPLINAGGIRNKTLLEKLKIKFIRVCRRFSLIKNSDYSQRFSRTSEQLAKDKAYDYENMLLFDEFRKKYFLTLTREYKTENDFIDDYPDADLYIVGSDQVWNLWVTNIQYPLFFFSFVKPGKKCISYAACMGGDSKFYFKNEEIKTISVLLKKFSGIAVRDVTGISILKKRFHTEAIQVLDPTFLPDVNVYNSILSDSELDGKGCLFNFKFIINESWVKVIRYIAEKMQLKIRMDSCLIPIEGFDFKPKCSVADWLRLIKTSDFIFTDSFHGMVFCILFRKNFIVTPSYKGGEERYMDLAKKFGLEDRVYFTPEEVISNSKVWSKSIDYDKVYQKIEKWQKISHDYINKYL